MDPINWEAYKGLQDKKDDSINRLDMKDVIAMSIAMLQLVLPIALGFIVITFLTILAFKWFFG
ncbi:hypothetical protein [Fusibacter sp. 3D3]|uniref:hypothetical protein n=1 Tax=Fusibacter sp. 3D3 TaxID=1048380 RepID=UPI000853BC21|nr:hypothetical protein [Fusibacter sp. 3D3]GAU79459.1 hypothetical protein F3D3_4123 [Fusibacter sp. 3D3]